VERGPRGKREVGWPNEVNSHGNDISRARLKPARHDGKDVSVAGRGAYEGKKPIDAGGYNTKDERRRTEGRQMRASWSNCPIPPNRSLRKKERTRPASPVAKNRIEGSKKGEASAGGDLISTGC